MPGDYVDVVLTQVAEKADLARRALSETLLYNIRIIAIDQEIVQGGPNNATAGKIAQTVSLQVVPEQVKRIEVAKHLGTLSLAMRAAVEPRDAADSRTISSCDVSADIARQNAIAGQSATVVVNAADKAEAVKPPEKQ
jgi:pilus assembly protein CpaB